MDRNLYYVGIAFFGMVNGIFNQLAPSVRADPLQFLALGAAVRQRAADL